MIAAWSFSDALAVLVIAVVLVTLMAAVFDLTAKAARQWWDAAPLVGEDLQPDKERES